MMKRTLASARQRVVAMYAEDQVLSFWKKALSWGNSASPAHWASFEVSPLWEMKENFMDHEVKGRSDNSLRKTWRSSARFYFIDFSN